MADRQKVVHNCKYIGHTVGAFRIMPKVCSSATTSEATRLSHTQLMMMLIVANVASILYRGSQLHRMARSTSCAAPHVPWDMNCVSLVATWSHNASFQGVTLQRKDFQQVRTETLSTFALAVGTRLQYCQNPGNEQKVQCMCCAVWLYLEA